MDTAQIIASLAAERDRLSRAIEALQGPAKRRGRKPGSRGKLASSAHAEVAITAPTPKRTLSASGRKAIANAAKRRWAAIKAGKAPSPFAKATRKKK